jgi:hypothetical protein
VSPAGRVHGRHRSVTFRKIYRDLNSAKLSGLSLFSLEYVFPQFSGAVEFKVRFIGVMCVGKTWIVKRCTTGMAESTVPIPDASDSSKHGLKRIMSNYYKLIRSQESRPTMHSLMAGWLPSVVYTDTVSSIFSLFFLRATRTH